MDSQGGLEGDGVALRTNWGRQKFSNCIVERGPWDMMSWMENYGFTSWVT